jgi:hypothetical protein
LKNGEGGTKGGADDEVLVGSVGGPKPGRTSFTGEVGRQVSRLSLASLDVTAATGVRSFRP